ARKSTGRETEDGRPNRQTLLDHLDKLIADFEHAAETRHEVPHPSDGSFLEIYTDSIDLKPLRDWPQKFLPYADIIREAWSESGAYEAPSNNQFLNMAHNLTKLRDAIPRKITLHPRFLMRHSRLYAFVSPVLAVIQSV